MESRTRFPAYRICRTTNSRHRGCGLPCWPTPARMLKPIIISAAARAVLAKVPRSPGATVARRASQESPGAMSSHIRRLARASERSVEQVEFIERAPQKFSGYPSARNGRPAWSSGIWARGSRTEPRQAGRVSRQRTRARQYMEHGKTVQTQWHRWQTQYSKREGPDCLA